MSQTFIAKLGHPSVHETFTTVSWCHTLFAPKAVCPKSCTKLYQEREKVPSLENASTMPMVVQKNACFDINVQSVVCYGFTANRACVKYGFIFITSISCNHSYECQLRDAVRKKNGIFYDNLSITVATYPPYLIMT